MEYSYLILIIAIAIFMLIAWECFILELLEDYSYIDEYLEELDLSYKGTWPVECEHRYIIIHGSEDFWTSTCKDCGATVPIDHAINRLLKDFEQRDRTTHHSEL